MFTKSAIATFVAIVALTLGSVSYASGDNFQTNTRWAPGGLEREAVTMSAPSRTPGGFDAIEAALGITIAQAVSGDSQFDSAFDRSRATENYGTFVPEGDPYFYHNGVRLPEPGDSQRDGAWDNSTQSSRPVHMR